MTVQKWKGGGDAFPRTGWWLSLGRWAYKRLCLQPFTEYTMLTLRRECIARANGGSWQGGWADGPGCESRGGVRDGVPTVAGFEAPIVLCLCCVSLVQDDVDVCRFVLV